MVCFATDLLFFFILAVLIGCVWHVSREEHLRRSWRKVITYPSAMVSLVIVLAYFAIALLDSIRFTIPLSSYQEGKSTSTEPVTLLDVLVGPLSTRVEKTYSAPLAVYAQSRETLRKIDGTEEWTYPRLTYGGAHLVVPEKEWFQDVFYLTLIGMIKGFLVGLFVVIGIFVCIGRHPSRYSFLVSMYHAEMEVPWKAMGLTVWLICIVIGMLGELSTQYHVLGTDKVGEDVLYQSLKSIRTGLLIGTLTTLTTLPFAVILGLLAGYFRGWVDDIIQYLYTTLNAIPGVLLMGATMLIIQTYMSQHEADFSSLAVRADFRLLALCLILGMTSWTGLCRLLRAETLKIRELEYIQAAQVLGVRVHTILIRHILPNVFHIVLISTVLDFSSLVLAEAVLSYISIGVDPTMASWGNMINSARLEMARDPVVWWSLVSAFLFMFGLVLPANLFADTVRDAFDPRRIE